jgi:hypothetical protein
MTHSECRSTASPLLAPRTAASGRQSLLFGRARQAAQNERFGFKGLIPTTEAPSDPELRNRRSSACRAPTETNTNRWITRGFPSQGPRRDHAGYACELAAGSRS